MRSTLVACGALAIIVAFALTGYFAPRADAATGPIPLNCNRACLENLVDQYLAAVVAHDPKRLPLSKDAKYTENNQVLDPGRRVLEDCGRPRQIHAHLGRSGFRSGGLHGDNA